MQIYSEMGGAMPDRVPEYFGGEFYGLTTKALRSVLSLAPQIKKDNDRRALAGQAYLSDEAHFFSFLMWTLGYRNPTANNLARRIWTTWKLNDTRLEDMELTVWHTPSEKTYGIARLFVALRGSRLCCESEEAARAWLARVGGRAEAAPEAFGAFRAGYRASPEVERAVVYLDDDHGETPMNEQYDQDWHDVYGTGTAHSAKAILRHVQSILDVRSVVEIGCGHGHWLAAVARTRH
jgi:hypothetical protein